MCVLCVCAQLADVDDEMGEIFLMEEDPSPEQLAAAIRRATVSLKFAPVMMGSAYKNKGVHSLLRSVAFTLGAVVAAGCISFVSFDYLLSNTHSRHGGTTSVAALLTFCELVFALVGMIAMGPFPWFHFPTLDIALRNNASGEAAIPMRYHLVISALEFIQSLCQNLALDFAHIPLPLFLVAANSGVAFNVAIGALCLGKRFSTGQLLGVALVVAGVLLAVSSKLAAASTELTGGVVKRLEGYMCGCLTLPRAVPESVLHHSR